MAVSTLTNSEGALDYWKVEMLFASLAAVGVVIGVYLNIMDAASGGQLNRSQQNNRSK